jgi:hypothetical protein
MFKGDMFAAAEQIGGAGNVGGNKAGYHTETNARATIGGAAQARALPRKVRGLDFANDLTGHCIGLLGHNSVRQPR